MLFCLIFKVLITLYLGIFSTMKSKLYGSLAAVVILAAVVAYQGNYLSYYNCMSATKLNYISENGAAHIAAQCRTFILEKAFTN